MLNFDDLGLTGAEALDDIGDLGRTCADDFEVKLQQDLLLREVITVFADSDSTVTELLAVVVKGLHTANAVGHSGVSLSGGQSELLMVEVGVAFELVQNTGKIGLNSGQIQGEYIVDGVANMSVIGNAVDGDLSIPALYGSIGGLLSGIGSGSGGLLSGLGSGLSGLFVLSIVYEVIAVFRVSLGRDNECDVIVEAFSILYVDSLGRTIAGVEYEAGNASGNLSREGAVAVVGHRCAGPRGLAVAPIMDIDAAPLVAVGNGNGDGVNRNDLPSGILSGLCGGSFGRGLRVSRLGDLVHAVVLGTIASYPILIR